MNRKQRRRRLGEPLSHQKQPWIHLVRQPASRGDDEVRCVNCGAVQALPGIHIKQQAAHREFIKLHSVCVVKGGKPRQPADAQPEDKGKSEGDCESV